MGNQAPRVVLGLAGAIAGKRSDFSRAGILPSVDGFQGRLESVYIHSAKSGKDVVLDQQMDICSEISNAYISADRLLH